MKGKIHIHDLQNNCVENCPGCVFYEGFDEGRRIGVLEGVNWKNAALRAGKMLSKTGPDGYYTFTPQQFIAWLISLREER